MKIVGVIRGGTGEEYETSLREGGEIITFLTEHLADKYQPVDILVDREGVWHCAGLPILPASLMHKIDMAWNTINPSFSRIFKNFSIPVLSEPDQFHALMQSREMLDEHMRKIGVNLPRHLLIPMYQPDFDGPVVDFAYRKAQEVFQKFGAPWVVKSLSLR